MNSSKLDPKSLHKYLYTEGDLVNGVVPMEREDLAEVADKIADKLSFYNNNNSISRFKQCQASVAKLLETQQIQTPVEDAFDAYLVQLEVSCA